MRGRKPKPTNLKILAGNPGRRPLPDGEPCPDAVLPTPPDFLDDQALREWERIAPELHQLGLLTRLDRAALAAYCQSYAHWIKAETALRAAWQTGEDGEIDSAKLKRLSVLCNRALR